MCKVSNILKICYFSTIQTSIKATTFNFKLHAIIKISIPTSTLTTCKLLNFLKKLNLNKLTLRLHWLMLLTCDNVEMIACKSWKWKLKDLERSLVVFEQWRNWKTDVSVSAYVQHASAVNYRGELLSFTCVFQPTNICIQQFSITREREKKSAEQKTPSSWNYKTINSISKNRDKWC